MRDPMRNAAGAKQTTISVGGYPFAGPYNDTKYLENRPGVYAIHVQHDDDFALVDVGESAAVQDRVLDHERKPCWMAHTHGGLIVFSAFYTPDLPEDSRAAMSRLIRETTKPPCGEG